MPRWHEQGVLGPDEPDQRIEVLRGARFELKSPYFRYRCVWMMAEESGARQNRAACPRFCLSFYPGCLSPTVLGPEEPGQKN